MSQNHKIGFLEFLQSHRRGDLLHEGNQLLEKITAAMMETGNDGELVIRMPFKLNKAGQVECSPKVTAKIPQRTMGTGIYFLDDEGSLSRRDPNQPDLVDEMGLRRSSEQNH